MPGRWLVRGRMWTHLPRRKQRVEAGGICYNACDVEGFAMTEGPSDSGVSRMVQLVLGVARLGEADLRGWWNCHGLDPVGSYILERTLPQTWRSAALELDVLSARRRHEDALSARRSALHLFSDELPFRRWTAAWLSEQKTADGVHELLDELGGWDSHMGMKRLREWAGDPEPGEVLASGLRLGSVRMPSHHDMEALGGIARCLGAAYLDLDESFRAPYLDLQA